MAGEDLNSCGEPKGPPWFIPTEATERYRPPPPIPPPRAVYITRHARQRCRQRLKVPKRAVDRLARMALAERRPREEFTGGIRSYLDDVVMKKHMATNIRVFRGFVFLFTPDTLITVWPLPGYFADDIRPSRVA